MTKEPTIDLFRMTGGACRRLPDPCPHVVCRFNLTGEKRDSRGAKPAGGVRLPVVQEGCALEAAERGGLTLEEIAERLALTRERVRQLEVAALHKLEKRLERIGWSATDVRDILAASREA